MKIAFLFPGQGAQKPGMGKDLYENYKEIREIYTKASEIVGKDIAKLTFEGSKEELTKTSNAQIAIATMSLGILGILKNNGIKPEIAVGLSLGEYPALIAGGYLSFKDGMELLKFRGRYMQENVEPGEYAMLAVVGLDSSKIQAICEKIENETAKFIAISNYNYSMQTVVSGEIEAINQAQIELKNAGAKRVVMLQTGGPFHTLKLAEAKKMYLPKLKMVKFNKYGNGVKVIKNIDGNFYGENDDFASILASHITEPIRFDKAIKLMKENKVEEYVEIGPGRTLTSFVKKENPDSNIKNIFNVETLENFLDENK